MSSEKVRVVAVGDIHVSEAGRRDWQELVGRLCEVADILVLPGDLTNRGRAVEAEVLVDGLTRCKVPVIAVLGNHDFECGEQREVTRVLCDAGVIVLDEEPYETHGVGFAGCRGFCGGFDKHALTPFGEQEIKDFVRVAVDEALRLESGLTRLRTEHKVAVLHYAPIRKTVEGEPPEIFPFLGSSRLADPIDHVGATVVLHGHAHNGSHQGETPKGTPVYNVALPLMRKIDAGRPYLLLEL